MYLMGSDDTDEKFRDSYNYLVYESEDSEEPEKKKSETEAEINT